MKVMDPVRWAAAIVAGILVTAVALPQARGELVYEENATAESAQAKQTADLRQEDRQGLRQAISTSQKAKATIAAEAPRNTIQPAPTTVVRPVIQVQPVLQSQPMVAQPPQASNPAPVYLRGADVAQAPVQPALTPVISEAPAAAPVEVQNLSKTELMRRERVREELKNEDVLQERLEELRLRDERRRTQELLSGKPMEANAEASQAIPVTLVPPGQTLPQDQMVVAPATERPGMGTQPLLPSAPQQAAPGPQPAAVAAAYPSGNPNGYPVQYGAQQDQIATSAAMSTTVANGGDSTEKTMLMIRPFVGIPGMSTNNSFDVKAHYAAGFGLGVGAGESITFDLGWTFSEYGVNIAPTNPWVASAQSWAYSQGRSNSLETLALKQNVFEAGLRFQLLNPDSKIRPFVGGGGGYSKSYMNYSQEYLNMLRQSGLQNMTRDYESSAYLGFLSTGFDVRVSKSVSVGANLKYYTVFSSSENQPVQYTGFAPTGFAPAGTFPGWASPEADKSNAGASLASSSFYTVTGGATFVF